MQQYEIKLKYFWEINEVIVNFHGYGLHFRPPFFPAGCTLAQERTANNGLNIQKRLEKMIQNFNDKSSRKELFSIKANIAY